MARTACYLKLDGVEGESKTKGHEKEIEILSWGFGASNASSAHLGGGSGVGQVSVQDLSISTYLDKASTPLMKLLMTGKHIDKAVLSCNKASGNDKAADHEYLKITMEHVYVTNKNWSGNGGDSPPMVSFTLSFKKVEIEYKEQTEKGGKGANPKASFNVEEGVAT